MEHNIMQTFLFDALEVLNKNADLHAVKVYNVFRNKYFIQFKSKKLKHFVLCVQS